MKPPRPDRPRGAPSGAKPPFKHSSPHGNPKSGGSRDGSNREGGNRHGGTSYAGGAEKPRFSGSDAGRPRFGGGTNWFRLV